MIPGGGSFSVDGRFILYSKRISGCWEAAEGERAHAYARAWLRNQMLARGIMPECFYIERAREEDATVYLAFAGRQ